MEEVDEMTKPSFGVVINDVEYLGVEVQFRNIGDKRGSVWIPFRPGMSILYGRNGAGKTSLLNAIRSALSGITIPGIKCRLFIRLLVTDDESKLDALDRQQEYSDLMAQWSEEIDQGFWLEEVEIGGESRSVVSGMPEMPRGTIPLNGWFFHHLISSVPKGCEFFNFDREAGGGFKVDAWQYPAPNLSLEQMDAEEWAVFQYPTWLEIVRLLLVGHAAWDDAFIERRRDDTGADYPPIDLDIYEMCREVENSRLLCLESYGSEAKPSWQMRLATQVVGETLGHLVLVKSIAALQQDADGKISDDLLSLIDEKVESMGSASERQDVVMATILGSTLMSELAIQHFQDKSNEFIAPYSPIGGNWATINIDRIPIVEKRFEPNIDVVSVIGKLLKDCSDLHQNGTLMMEFQDDKNIIESYLPEIDMANERLDSISRKIRDIGIGISGLRLSLQGGIQSALYGGLLALQVRDAITDNWISIDQLSSAQSFWVGFLLEIDDSYDSRTTFLLADEVDQGMAERAVAPMLMLLESLYPLCLVGSHSPSALRSNIGFLNHVERDDNGVIRLSSPRASRDFRETANLLGISIAELLSFLQVVVLVEGEHDRVVFEEFLFRQRGSSQIQTRIVPFRGIRQLTNIDSRILLDFTDASIVLIVDGARQDRIDEALSNANKIESGQKKPARLLSATAPLRLPDSSEEEKMLADVIEQACIRGMLNRISLVGLAVHDIILAFSPTNFALDKSWSHYQDQWKHFRNKHASTIDFKSYLRDNHGAKINVNSVEGAASKLSVPPTDLWKALETVERAQFAAGMRRVVD